MKNLSFLAVCFLVVLFLGQTIAVATTYYVSSSNPNRSDSNPGTDPNAPWESIARVNSATLQPGDTIRFQRGDLWRDTLFSNRSGISGAPVTYTAYGTGENPVIWGSNLITGWTDLGDDLYSAPSAAFVRFVVVDGDEKLARVVPLEDPGTLPANSFGMRDGVLYIRYPNVPSIPVEAAQRNHGIYITGENRIIIDGIDVRNTNFANIRLSSNSDDVTIRNLALRWANSSNSVTAGAGISTRSSDRVMIDNVTIRDAHGDGVFIFGGIDCTVQNSTIFSVFKGGNSGGDNIQFTGGGSTDGFHILNNFLTAENTDGFKGVVQQERGDNGIIAGNTVLYGAFGIEVNGNNILVENNFVAFTGVNRPQDNFSAGLYLSEFNRYENVTFRNNIVYGCQRNAINMDATNGSGSEPPYFRRNFRFINNTIIDCGTAFKGNTPVSGEFKNNILWNIRNQLIQFPAAIPDEPFVSDFNLVMNSTGSATVRVGGVEYPDFPSYVAGTGQDQNSRIGDPLLVNDSPTDPTPADFKLLEGSPAIDAGQFVGSVSDFEGNAIPDGNGPDIGAFESPFTTGNGEPPPSPPSNLTATAIAPDEIRLDWTPSATESVAGYNIYRSTTPSFLLDPTYRIISLVSDTRYFDEQGLAFSTGYFYRVTAVSSGGLESAAVSADATTLSGAPGLLAYEPFNYTPGQGLDSQEGGTGWGGPWAAGPSVGLDDDGVDRIGIDNRGGAAVLQGFAQRRLANVLGVSGSSVWLGLAVRNRNEMPLEVVLGDVGTDKITISLEPGQPIRVNGVASETTATRAWHFLAARISFLSPTETVVSVWLDPSFTNGDPGVETALLASSFPVGGLIDRVRLRLDEAVVLPSHVDELRIGGSFSSIRQTGFADLIAPTPPRGVSASALGPSQVNIDWEANGESDIASYRVYRSTDPALVATPVNQIAADLVATEFSDNLNLVPGTPYYYGITSVDTPGNESALSPIQLVNLPALTSTFLAYEGFDHPSSTPVNGLSGGDLTPDFGFAGPWSATETYSIVQGSGSLEHPDLETHGRLIRLRGNATRPLAVGQGGADSGVYWVGVLLRSSNSSRDARFSLTEGGTPRVTIEHRPGRDVEVNGNSTGVASGSTPKFVLLRLDFGSTLVEAHAWVDYVLADGEPDLGTADLQIASLPVFPFDGIRLEHTSTSSHQSLFDEIRLGRVFEDAVQGTRTPVPGTNMAPTASFLASTLTGEAPLQVELDASGSSDPDGEVIAVRWDFGDGTAEGSGVVTTHTFLEAGVFEVEMTAIDNGSFTDTATQTITVLPSTFSVIRLETEDIPTTSTELETDTNSFAGNGLVSEYQSSGTFEAWRQLRFPGQDGLYSLRAGYFDESDGEAFFAVHLDGRVAGSLLMDNPLTSRVADGDSYLESTLGTGIAAKTGDWIELFLASDEGELLRHDYIEFVLEGPLNSYNPWSEDPAYAWSVVGVDDLPLADPEGDHLNNLLEHVYGLHPLITDSAEGQPRALVRTIGSTPYIDFRYRLARDLVGVAVDVQYSYDGSSWMVLSPGTAIALRESADENADWITLRLPQSFFTEGRVFFRIVATLE